MTPKRPQPPAERSLDAVLAIEHLPRFYDALWKFTMPTFKQPLAELPELVRMVRVLLFLDFHVRYTRGGIEEFLGDWISETNEYFSTYFHEAEEWCRDIGAHRAAAYLRAVAELFPGAKVPTDVVNRMRSQGEIAHHRPNPFKRLDREYKGATREMIEHLRTYLRAHRAEAEAAYAEALGGAEAARQIPAILRLADPLRFFDALIDRLSPKGLLAQEFDRWPEPVRVAILLRALWINVSNDGMWKFLAEGTGSDAHFTEAWCRRIGARRAAAYLAAAAKLFPRGRIPTDEEKRFNLVMEFDERSPDPLRQLDRRYEGAVDEMVERFRAHLRANEDDIEGALTTPARKPAAAKRRRTATGKRARPKPRRR